MKDSHKVAKFKLLCDVTGVRSHCKMLCDVTGVRSHCKMLAVMKHTKGEKI